MSKLTDEQIEFIEQQVNNSLIDSDELKEDLIDHFCCVIEEYMDKGRTFEESYNTAYQIVCPNGFNEIYKESLLLLTSNNIIIMKKSMYILGFIATVLLTTSILFKLMHWPGTGVLITLGAFMLIFVLLPIIALYFYKKEFSEYISYKLKSNSTFAITMRKAGENNGIITNSIFLSTTSMYFNRSTVF